MMLIGLTGPSGAGKGLVAAFLAERGVPILDADAIYHELLLPPSPCLDALVGHFGKEILTPEGTLDRARLGRIVFSDAAELARLNGITHTFVMEEIRRRIDRLRREDPPVVLLDAPQLLEAGADRDCDRVLALLAPLALRRERILTRDGISKEAAERRLAAQKPDDFFIARADAVLSNDTSTEELFSKLRTLLLSWGVSLP